MNQQQGLLIIHTERLGTVRQITDLLFDIENLYDNVYLYHLLTDREYKNHFFDRYDNKQVHRLRDYLNFRYEITQKYLIEEFLQVHPIEHYIQKNANIFNRPTFRDLVPETDRLYLNKVNIQSPGFWEFLGALNPLSFILDLTKLIIEVRKERRNRPYEEQRQILELAQMKFKTLKEGSEWLKSIGLTDDQIQTAMKNHILNPSLNLMKHLDSGLIEFAELKNTTP